MHDGNGRIGRPDLARDPEREVGTVDCDETVGFPRDDGVGGLPDPAQQARQVAQHRADADQRDVAGVEDRRQAEFAEMAPADAGKLDGAARQTLQCAHQIRAEQVARFLAGHHGEPERT